MARQGRRRAKWYVGGGIVLILLFLLGDPYGTFRSADRGVETGRQPEPGDGPRSDQKSASTADPEASAVRPPPDPVPNARLASGGPGVAASSTAAPGVESRPPDPDSNAARVAQLDHTVGIIHRFEQALSADRLADLAVLVDRVRNQPVDPSPALAERWRAVQARAATALDCGDRLRAMIRNGEILEVQRLLVPLLRPTTPSFMRDRLDAAAVKFGWPALTRNWTLRTAGAATVATPLGKMRLVRFVKDDELQEGRLWRIGATETTVRVTGLGGFTFPVVPRHAVEPVSPQPQEALSQGLAAAGADDPRRVLLWCCFCHEHDESAAAAQLRALLNSP